MAPRVRVKKSHNTLKHGGYSTMGLLPGESPAEFEQLCKKLIDEFVPRGPLADNTNGHTLLLSSPFEGSAVPAFLTLRCSRHGPG